MEQYLLRNHETRKYLQEQAYRLQQGIVTTTTQQVDAALQIHYLNSSLIRFKKFFLTFKLVYNSDDGHDVCESPGSP